MRAASFGSQTIGLALSGVLFLTHVSAQSEIPPDLPPLAGTIFAPVRPPGLVDTVISRAALSGEAGRASLTIHSHVAIGQNRLTLDLRLRTELPGTNRLSIRFGAANGPIVYETAVSAPAGTFEIRVPATTGNRNTLSEITANPYNYFVVLTSESGASISGRLAASRRTVNLGLMSPANEVPAISGYDASATGAVITDIARSPSGEMVSASITFDILYRFPEAPTFTGLHVHSGAAGVNGPVILDSGLRAGGDASPAAGNLRYTAEMDLTRPEVVASLNALESEPSGHYVNLHTTRYTGGVVRAQLRPTERYVEQTGYGVNPLAGTDNRIADASRTIDFIRDRAGNASAAVQTVNVQFADYPTGVAFTADLSPLPASPDGVYYAAGTVDPANLGALNDILREKIIGCFNLTTSDSVPVTCDRTYRNSGPIQINAVVVAGRAVTTAAPGTAVQLFGTFPGPISTPGGRFGQPWPLGASGMEVTVGDAKAALSYVSLNQINAQIPAELRPGSYQVRVHNLNFDVSSAPFPLVVLPRTPYVLSGEGGTLVYKNNGTLVAPGNEAGAGDVITVYATGLGDTAPVSLVTGQPASANANVQGGAVVMFGTRQVEAQAAYAVPGLIGVYAVTTAVPPGITPGLRNIGVNDSRQVPTWFR